MRNISLVVLAAGIGSRYGGLKQMDPVGPSGEFILDYSVYDAIQAGFNKVVFVIRRDIEKDFKTIMGKRIGRHVHTEYVYQELDNLPTGWQIPVDRKKPWGTGHAVMTAAAVVHEPFAVINADDFYGRESYHALADFLKQTYDESSKYCMIGFVLENTVSEYGTVARGVCSADKHSFLASIVERTKIEKGTKGIRYQDENGNWIAMTGKELVSMNMWGFKTSLFHYLTEYFMEFLKERGNDPKAEFFVPTVVNNLIMRRLVSVQILPTPCAWFGITYPQDKSKVVSTISNLVGKGIYPNNLWA